MTHLMGAGARPKLHEFARTRSVAVFDFDGTLAPIVADRELAHMRPRTRALLARVCDLYPCAVVSGRSLADTIKHLDGLPISMVFGSHGLEPGPHLKQYQRMMVEVRIELERHLGGVPWCDVEDKRYSLAVHYRAAPNRAEAHRAVLQAAGKLTAPVRLVEGKCVVNIVPRDAPHKGEAVLSIQRHYAAERVMFVGDDVTDEHAFRYALAHQWLGVRIGKSDHSAAQYYLRRQREIDLLLARLIRLRSTFRLSRNLPACAE
ncbi:MAG: trehalose-phosphatase [Myxococcales bacterium]